MRGELPGQVQWKLVLQFRFSASPHRVEQS
jgi:hypothetical protein